MSSILGIDIKYDFRTDSSGKDPDRHSATLKRFHQTLWSKQLPNGIKIDLQPDPAGYLCFKTPVKTFRVASDAITNSYKATKRMEELGKSVPQIEIEETFSAGNTIGAYIVFPGNRVEGKMTINGARGFNRKIADRFDLTLECIRRHYEGLDHPLATVLTQNQDFFALFGNFRGYVDFFLLQDLVAASYSNINFFINSGSNFEGTAYPSNVSEYRKYLEETIDFISRRNKRILREG